MTRVTGESRGCRLGTRTVLLGPRNQIDEAMCSHLRRVIEINPRNADVHRNLAVGLGLQGKIDEAPYSGRHQPTN